MVGSHVSFSGLVSMFICDILKNYGGCVQICNECIAPTCNSLPRALTQLFLPIFFTIRHSQITPKYMPQNFKTHFIKKESEDINSCTDLMFRNLS
jgi:hypothetical protein